MEITIKNLQTPTLVLFLKKAQELLVQPTNSIELNITERGLEFKGPSSDRDVTLPCEANLGEWSSVTMKVDADYLEKLKSYLQLVSVQYVTLWVMLDTTMPVKRFVILPVLSYPTPSFFPQEITFVSK